MKRFSLLCVLALTLGTVAMANIIPTNTSVTPLGANFTWNYSFQVAADQNVNSGTVPSSFSVPPSDLLSGGFVTIYDFNGYVAGSCASPLGWTCLAQNIGFTPSNVNPPDSASVVNLTWFYTSGSTIVGGPVTVNGFSAVSIYSLPEQIWYTSRGWRNSGQQIGTIGDNVGNTTGPAPTPEPATLALLGSGILAGAFRLKSILTVKR